MSWDERRGIQLPQEFRYVRAGDREVGEEIPLTRSQTHASRTPALGRRIFPQKRCQVAAVRDNVELEHSIPDL